MTAMLWQPADRQRRRIAGAAALAVQATVLLLLLRGTGRVLIDRLNGPAVTSVRLVTVPERTRDDELRRTLAPRPPAVWLPAPIVVPPISDFPNGVPPDRSVQAAVTPVASASAASAPSDRSRAPLNLALPKAAMQADPHTRMAEQIRNDERAHTAPRTVESALADAAGTLPIVTSVSTSGTGSKLVRQGSKCVRVYENRIAALNPTDDRLKDAPSVSSSCYNK